MKTINSVIICIVIIFLKLSALSQGFQNLNFEQANLSGYGQSGSVSAADAIPGWTAYISGTPQTNIIYNAVPLADAEVTLQSTNTSRGFPISSIEGNYYVMLWGEFNPNPPNNPAFETNSAAIGQTGQIPLSTLSLTFWGTIGGMQATFNGQPINFLVTGSTANYTIYSADISAYAGQTGQLLFTDPYYGNTFGGPASIDNIQFSTAAVPEPSVLGLSALGGLLLAWRRWQKFH